MFKVLIVVGLLTQNVYHAKSTCEEGKFYPHETECGQFYQCANGKLVTLHCPATLEFSTKINVCTSPDESGCQLNAGDNNNNGDKPSDDITTPACNTSPSTCTPSPSPTCTPSPSPTCTPSPSPTCTPSPTPTPTPTCTPSPTPTPTPTCTPSPTPTPTPTCTPSPSPTCTPSPTPTCTPPKPTCSSPPPCTDPPHVDIPQPYPGCPNCIADPSRDVLLPLPKCCQFVHCTNFGIGVVKNCAPSDPPLVFSPCEQRCVWPWEAGNVTCDPCTC